MSGVHAETKKNSGGSAAVANQPPGVSPGKVTATSKIQPSKSKPEPQILVGDKFVDEGLGCEEQEEEAACFLEPGQRDRILQEYTGRVHAAQMAYTAAIEEIRTDELMKHGSEVSWLMLILVQVIGTGISLGISKVLKGLQGGAENKLWDLKIAQSHTGALPGMRDKIFNALTSVSEEAMGKAVGQIVYAGKFRIKDVLKAKHTAQIRSEQEPTLDFLDLLKENSAIVFQDLRERVPAEVPGDGPLVVLWQAWDASMGHTINNYKRFFQEEIGRFKSDGLDKVGSNTDDGGDVVDTKLKWVFDVDTREKKLARYQQKTVRPKHMGANYGSSPVVGDEKFVSWISEDLVEVALEIHKSRWGKEPELEINSALTGGL